MSVKSTRHGFMVLHGVRWVTTIASFRAMARGRWRTGQRQTLSRLREDLAAAPNGPVADIYRALIALVEMAARWLARTYREAIQRDTANNAAFWAVTPAPSSATPREHGRLVLAELSATSAQCHN